LSKVEETITYLGSIQIKNETFRFEKSSFCLRVYQETTINILIQDIIITVIFFFLLLRAVTTIFFPICRLLDSNIYSTSQLEAYKKKNKINLFTKFNTDNIDVQKSKTQLKSK